MNQAFALNVLQGDMISQQMQLTYLIARKAMERAGVMGLARNECTEIDSFEQNISSFFLFLICVQNRRFEAKNCGI
jgi:hypothetical protein